jgi:membrane-associated protease RseP (regulator of RpoE activity)
MFLIGALGGVGVANAAPGSGSPSAPGHPGDPGYGDVQLDVPAGRPRLGIAALEISAALRTHFGAPGDRGVLVNAVQPDTPASRAGLQVGDILTDVAGAHTRTASDVIGALADHKRGEDVALTVIRDRKQLELRAKLDTDPVARWQRGNRRSDELPGWGFPEGSPDLRDTLDDLRQRIERLEQRLDHTRGVPGARST